MRAFAAFMLVLCASAAIADQPNKQPNILLILIDDLGYEAIGAYGGTSYATPNIDALAESGVRFTHAYATPLCSPSRVQLMTGRYNDRNYTEWGVLPASEITFGNILSGAGYATFMAGKWQLWGHELLWPVDEPCCLHAGQTPADAGFDEYLAWYLGKKGKRYADPVLSTGPTSNVEHEGEYGPDLLTDFIVESIERHANSDRPFFGYYSMVLTHDPFLPTPDMAGWQDHRHQPDRANFTGMVQYVDKSLGRIVASLEQLGVRNDTLIVLTADNGTPRGIESRLADGRIIAGAKGTTIGDGTHVPFIVSWPASIMSSSVTDALVDLTDVLPTLAAAAGAELDGRAIDGHDLIPLLRGRADSVRDWVFTDYRSGHPCCPPQTYVHNRRYKLYADGRFFDHENDPLEQHPIDAEALDHSSRAARSDLAEVLRARSSRER